VISLIAFLAVCLIYVATGLALFTKVNFAKAEEIIGGACLISVIGYLFAGLFNDSVTSVAPLFWLILGIGISINVRVRKNIANNAQVIK
jgi:hypothetical protein